MLYELDRVDAGRGMPFSPQPQHFILLIIRPLTLRLP